MHVAYVCPPQPATWAVSHPQAASAGLSSQVAALRAQVRDPPRQVCRCHGQTVHAPCTNPHSLVFTLPLPQLSASQRVLGRSAGAAPPPPPQPRARTALSRSAAPAVRGFNAQRSDDSGKDAIIRHLRSDNERLEKLVVDAVNAGERVATAALAEQVRVCAGHSVRSL